MTTGRTMVETVTLCVCGGGGAGIDHHNSDDVNGHYCWKACGHTHSLLLMNTVVVAAVAGENKG